MPLTWSHDHLIEVQKVKGADLVEQAHEWLTVTRPRPSLGLGADTVHAGKRVRIVVSGVRAHAKYEVFSSQARSIECNCGGGTSAMDCPRYVLSEPMPTAARSSSSPFPTAGAAPSF